MAADRLGYGPLAYHRKLLKKLGKPWSRQVTEKERKEIVKKLMGYIRYALDCVV